MRQNVGGTRRRAQRIAEHLTIYIPSTYSAVIVLNAKFDTYPMRKTIPAQENAGLVTDDFFEMLH